MLVSSTGHYQWRWGACEWADRHQKYFCEVWLYIFGLTKGRLLYLKTQFVPRSKHFSSRL